MTMAIKKQVYQKAKELGVEISSEMEDWPESRALYFTLDAPQGYVMSCSSCHSARVGKSGDWKYIMDELNEGLEECPDGEECSLCNK